MEYSKSILIKYLLLIIAFSATWSCSKNKIQKPSDSEYSEISHFTPEDTLYRIFEGEHFEYGVPCGYTNQNENTVIPIGKYTYCFTDTITTFGIVGPIDSHIAVAIDQNENKLYEVKWYDNGPDYVSEGLFRIIRNGKVGYADTTGRIIIEPQFDCTQPFKNGKAKVTFDCNLVKTGEHSLAESNFWFYIDKRGKKIK